VARTRAPDALPDRIPVGASSTTSAAIHQYVHNAYEQDLHSKGEALHPEAPRRYGSGNGFPRVTESAVTNTFGVVNPAIGIAFPA
jgi:hypothetical protein